MVHKFSIFNNKEENLSTKNEVRKEELSDNKSHLLSSISHELRTPINAILGLTNIMDKETSDPKLKSNCEKIRHASKELISSVNDILDLWQIEKGILQLKKTDFCGYDVLEKLLSSKHKQAKELGLNFCYETNLEKNSMLFGDAFRLEQIIHNILSTAFKNASNGEISFKAKSTINNGILTLNISIQNSGIANSQLTFDKTDSKYLHKNGDFDIALAVAKALVELHEGTINIASVLSHNTKYEIELKYSVNSSKTQVLNVFPKDEYDLLGKHVLIVEDNEMNRMILQMILGDWKNTKTTLANNGAHALELLKSDNTIDLILMDLQMPIMDGFEAITAIRSGLAEPHNSSKPIIVVTADVTSKTKQRVFNLGANEYLNKPFDEELMYKKITEVLSSTMIEPNDLTQSA